MLEFLYQLRPTLLKAVRILHQNQRILVLFSAGQHSRCTLGMPILTKCRRQLPRFLRIPFLPRIEARGTITVPVALIRVELKGIYKFFLRFLTTEIKLKQKKKRNYLVLVINSAAPHIAPTIIKINATSSQINVSQPEATDATFTANVPAFQAISTM